jgi:hypothetical protein
VLKEAHAYSINYKKAWKGGTTDTDNGLEKGLPHKHLSINDASLFADLRQYAKFAHFSPVCARELCQLAQFPLGRGFTAIWQHPLGG